MEKQMEQSMKFRTFTCVAEITLFAALANPVRLAAQEQSEQQRHKEHQHRRYKLVDIGTFGGPARYVDGDHHLTGASARFLNNHGVIAGWAETSANDPYSPNCLPMTASSLMPSDGRKAI